MNKANVFLNAGWFGLAGLGAAVVAELAELPEPVTIVGMVLAVIAAAIMAWARNSDEYTAKLWTAGASVAFGTMLIVYMTMGWVEGFVDGLTGLDREQDIKAEVIPVFAIAAFYIGLFVKRLLGDN